MKSVDFIDTLKFADRLAMRRTLLELPAGLRQKAKKTAYKIEPTSSGERIFGLQKFMGAGMVPQGDADTNQMQVQVTTYFVKEVVATRTRNTRIMNSISSLMACQYAEFVNSIDVSNGRFIVEKVFLNNVCPSGQRVGARATAEQLWASIWSDESKGKAILPVSKIKEIKFSDVVNWNTFCIMSIAMRADLGEGFSLLEDQELKTAMLTRSECTSMSTLEVFSRTCLGKFMKSLIALWFEWTGVHLKCTSATCSYTQGFEIIAGEPRHAMDICVQVSAEILGTPQDQRSDGLLHQKAPEDLQDDVGAERKARKPKGSSLHRGFRIHPGTLPLRKDSGKQMLVSI